MPDKEQNTGYLRSRFRDLEPGNTTDPDNKAYAQYMSLGPATPLLHTELVVDSSGEVLPTIPAEARRVILYSVTADVTFTDVQGDSPNNTHGMIIPLQTVYIYDSEPTANFKLWAATPTSVRIAYYG